MTSEMPLFYLSIPYQSASHEAIDNAAPAMTPAMKIEIGQRSRCLAISAATAKVIPQSTKGAAMNRKRPPRKPVDIGTTTAKKIQIGKPADNHINEDRRICGGIRSSL